MKRFLTLLTVLLCATLSAFAQGDSPYARFGYEGKVLRTPQERQQRMMLVVPNPDTAAAVAAVGLDPAKQKYYLFDKQNQILASDTLAATTVSKFLSVDPLTNQYPWLTPYQFASNTPIQSLDIDGREAYDYRLYLDANGHRLKGEFLGRNRGPLGNWNLPTLLGIQVFSIVVVQEGQPTNNYTFSLHDNEASQKYADKFLHDESFRRKWMNTEPTDAEKQTAVAKEIGNDVADGFTTAAAVRYGQSRSQSVTTATETTPKNFLTTEEFSSLPGGGFIDPKKLRFSQNSINESFKDGGSVSDITEGIKNGTIDPTKFPAVRIVEVNGEVYTLDNRRVKAFQDAGVPIRYQKLDNVPKRELFKFTTKNKGESIDVRSQKQ